jgi:hemerythrin
MELEPDVAQGRLEMDAQHQALERLHAEALEAVTAGEAADALVVLQALTREVRAHFAFEERLMVAAGYPERAAHRADHTRYASDLDALCRSAKDGAWPLVHLWLESRSRGWWRLHLATNDAALARWLDARAAATLAAPEAQP